MGCTTERSDFHSKDGAQFNSAMTVPHFKKAKHEEYTYEAWFKSPLEGRFRREIFGGKQAGLVLVNEAKTDCKRWGQGANEQTPYQLHVGGTNAYSSTCFQKNMFYHVAVTRASSDKKHPGVKVYVNGHEVASAPAYEELQSEASDLEASIGGGFADGGQLFNVRIWDHARAPADILEYSAVTNPDLMGSLGTAGLKHWWPLMGDTMDVMTGESLKGADVRYAPIWCADFEATGMRVC